MDNLSPSRIFQYLLLAFALFFTLLGLFRGFKYLCLELFGKPIPAEVAEVKTHPSGGRKWGVKNPPKGLKEVLVRFEVNGKMETLKWITAEDVKPSDRVPVLYSPLCGKGVKEDLKGVVFGSLSPLWFGLILFALYGFLFKRG